MADGQAGVCGGRRSDGQTGRQATAAVGAQPAVDFASECWEAQLARLAAYKAEHGDCNVPHGWAYPRLGRWVATQRQGKKALDRGEASDGMTAARAARLTALGFVWYA
jgi:hypothetical protein